jgi:hypothetical protein
VHRTTGEISGVLAASPTPPPIPAGWSGRTSTRRAGPPRSRTA